MPRSPRRFNEDDHRLLRLAIDRAESWRGSLMPADYADFDADINDMRAALKRAVETIAHLKAALGALA